MASSPPQTTPAARRLPAGERRAQILREAARCFGTCGFRGTTTRDVAARVGITEAALYRYFPSKEAIYAAHPRRAHGGARPDRADRAAGARAGDDRGGLHGARARDARERSRPIPSFLRLLLYSALEGHELAQPFHEAADAPPARVPVAATSRGASREGAFRDDRSRARRARLPRHGRRPPDRAAGLRPARRATRSRPRRSPTTYVAIFLDGMRARPARRARWRGASAADAALRGASASACARS